MKWDIVRGERRGIGQNGERRRRESKDARRQESRGLTGKTSPGGIQI